MEKVVREIQELLNHTFTCSKVRMEESNTGRGGDGPRSGRFVAVSPEGEAVTIHVSQF